jgi:DNA polymerase-3 subunit gamma/tau
LINSIRREKIGHAYLFAGPRGVGKTSIARIFARAINCSAPVQFEPCGECSTCKEILSGASFAVREIDGASHNSVDNIRDLIDSFRSLPPPGYKNKVYIIDEVHMLSVAAFNALLKSLEEPPPNTIFILATTEVHKIPETVLSRCQKFELRALPPETIEMRLRKIAATDKLDVQPEVFRLVARLADGSMRDSQSLFDRVQSYCDSTTVTLAEASEVLAVVERGALLKLSQAIIGRNADQALSVVGQVFQSGIDAGLFLRDFVLHWRELMIARCAGEAALQRLGVTDAESVELRRLGETLSTVDAQDLFSIARSGADSATRSAHVRYSVEALVVRMALREPVQAIQDLMAAVKGGGTSGVAASFGGSEAKEIRRPQVSDRVVPKSPATAAPVAPVASGATRPFDWGEFVEASGASFSRILVEHLRRVEPHVFRTGVLELKGPAFSLSALKDPQILNKLKDALKAFAGGGPEWSVSFGGAQAVTSEGSIAERDKAKSQTSRMQLESQVLQHPKIQSLQKLFPGSTIEQVSVEEEE